jgi:UDPglucose 6-dehydrogenase
MVSRNLHAKRLIFTTDVAQAVRDCEIIFIAVGTPMRADRHADLSAVRAVAREIGLALNGPKIVVSKSTVPVETGELVGSIIREQAQVQYPVSVVSNPEFLREGSAVADFLQPDRIVIGTDDPEAELVMRDLYAPLDAPVVVTDVRTSEMIKYAANAFLATKVSFVNEIANICELVGVDVRAVCSGIGYDKRIGTRFMSPGIGYGGSCFPKDILALEQLAVERDYSAPLLHAVELVNRRQVERTVVKLERAMGALSGRVVAVLGLAFKPNTDDIRDAPALAIIQRLIDRGASIRAHDPIANAAAAAVLGGVTFCDDMYEAVAGADAILLATEWNEFRMLDFGHCAEAMRGDVIFDGRNIFDAQKVRAAGLRYIGVGRVTLGPRNGAVAVYENEVTRRATPTLK